MARPGEARLGRRGMAWPGEAQHGAAGPGKARNGRVKTMTQTQRLILDFFAAHDGPATTSDVARAVWPVRPYDHQRAYKWATGRLKHMRTRLSLRSWRDLGGRVWYEVIG